MEHKWIGFVMENSTFSINAIALHDFEQQVTLITINSVLEFKIFNTSFDVKPTLTITSRLHSVQGLYVG
jgi:hypothetical protein